MIKNKPYHLLLCSAALLLLVSLFISQPYGELKLFDTYFITPMAPFMQFAALILFIFWVVYMLTARFLDSKELTWIHVVSTIIGTMIFIISIFNGFTRSVGAEGGIVESTGFTLGTSSPIVVVVAVLAVVLGQFLYFINLFRGLLKK